MKPKTQPAEIYSQKLSQRINLISQARSGTRSEKRLATQKLMESGLLTKAHNGRGIGFYETPRRTRLGVWTLNLAIGAVLIFVGWAYFA